MIWSCCWPKNNACDLSVLCIFVFNHTLIGYTVYLGQYFLKNMFLIKIFGIQKQNVRMSYFNSTIVLSKYFFLFNKLLVKQRITVWYSKDICLLAKETEQFNNFTVRLLQITLGVLRQVFVFVFICVAG